MRFEYRDASALVVGGELREIAFTGRATYHGKANSLARRFRFSQFGTVSPIEAPPADQVKDLPQTCDGGVIESLGAAKN